MGLWAAAIPRAHSPNPFWFALRSSYFKVLFGTHEPRCLSRIELGMWILLKPAKCIRKFETCQVDACSVPSAFSHAWLSTNEAASITWANRTVGMNWILNSWWFLMAKTFKTTYVPCRSLFGKTFWAAKQTNEIKQSICKLFSVISNRDSLLPGMQAYGRPWIYCHWGPTLSVAFSRPLASQTVIWNFVETESLSKCERIRVWTIDVLDIWFQIYVLIFSMT